MRADGDTGERSDAFIGRTIGGSFTIQQVLGVGGMGRVYRAEQAVLGRTVAAKVIHPHLLGDDQTVARFYNEARAASRLNHPNSVGIIDFGRTDDGVLYLVMEYITGKDLATVMREEGPLPFTRICHVLDGVLDALCEAHALGVVHRDLKPENIILRRFRLGSDLVKVVDFGLATIAGGADTSITRPGLVCGTPDYMSPEQGRGDQVDGRGDLYSLGVVLFELLAEKLPYDDETPTKVVLRHISDPIPDPRDVAPYRGIPDALAEVTMRALSKDVATRYQSAEEFQYALRQTRESLQPRSPEASVGCGACGADNAPSSRFCGACGARLTGRVSVPPELRSDRPSFRPAEEEARGLVDRDEPVAQLWQLRSKARGQAVRVSVHGEPGVGKTRLLEEAAREFAAQGDFVAWAQPHPSGAPVPYAPLRRLLAALFGVEENELQRLTSSEGSIEDPITRAGIAEVVEPSPVSLALGRSRTGSVAVALSAGIDAALWRTGRERVVLVVDDLARGDGLSQQALTRLARYVPYRSLMLLAAGELGEEAHRIELERFGLLDAERFLQREEGPAAQAAVDADGRATIALRAFAQEHQWLPLYLEQLEALGLGTSGRDTLPPRLADAVLQRAERLGLSARRVFQAAAVLGEWCERNDLLELVGEADMKGLDELRKADLVRVREGGIRIVHPFIRELVEASIPAEARRELHEAALRMANEAGAPLEVRAEHAYRAGEPMSALMLLERMGDVALERGDTRAAVLAFRRGLELARREALDRGETSMDRAIVTFSRKLGEALEAAGDVAGADGVVREAVDLAGPASLARARMLLTLGTVSARRGRPQDAMRVLCEGIEITDRGGGGATATRLQLALARVCRQQGDAPGAMEAYTRALEGFQADGEQTLRANVALELAEMLVEAGDTADARFRLEQASEWGRASGARVVAAQAIGWLGHVDELEGRREQATGRYEDAARLAAEAGDAESHAQWRQAAAQLAR